MGVERERKFEARILPHADNQAKRGGFANLEGKRTLHPDSAVAGERKVPPRWRRAALSAVK